MRIIAAAIPRSSILVSRYQWGLGYNASFFWTANHRAQQVIKPGVFCCNGMSWATLRMARFLAPTRYFGWQVTCVGLRVCPPPIAQMVNISHITLTAVDDTPPTILPLGAANLFNTSGRWVRGVWPASFAALDDSGICNTHEVIAGHTLAGPSTLTPNRHSWTQCPTPVTMMQSIDTTAYADGVASLTLSANDAATPANVAAPARTLHVDNQPVRLTLSGVTDAPSTAGTQFVTATASAGPSGVAGIECSTDGAPYRWFASSAATLPVAGLGVHRVFCFAENNAVNAAGVPATSPRQSWALSIRQPTVFGIGFLRVVNALRCAKKRERVWIPAHWVTVHYHGRKMRVKVPGQTRTITVVRCHPRVVIRRVRIHGHWKKQKIVLVPHEVRDTVRRVTFGAGTTVSGWLGTAAGDALGGQPVRILTAPDDGGQQFSQLTVVHTAADGSWKAHLPPGPSRLIDAVYGGSTTTEPTISAPVRLVVPAALALNITPRQTHWGSTIKIRGRLRGGYVPPAGELVVLWVGWPGGHTEIGHLYAARDGSFGSTYTFLRGNGSFTYRLWASTARESDYPYAPGRSRKIAVTVTP